MSVRIVGAERPLLTAALSLALTVTGCATGHSGGSGWNLTAKAKRPAADSSAEVMSEESVAEAGENPFRDPDAMQTASVSATKEKPAAGPAVSGETPRFDAATMMLIETEFKDATAEERKRWFAELKEVPPEMIPRILKMRRLTQQALQEQKDAAPALADSSIAVASNEVVQPQLSKEQEQPASRTAARTSDYPASENRLQAVAPWDTSSEPQPNPPVDQAVAPANNGIALTSATANPNGEPATHTAGYNQPADLTSAMPSAGRELSYEEQLEQLIATTEKRIAALKPGELEEEQLDYASQHAYLRMLYLMADRQERALEAIPHLPTAEQEFWQQMFWAMSSYFDSTGIPNPSDRATHTVSQLTEANARLRERANLELRNLAFCKKIDAFGIYERFDRNEFRPGQPVLVYAEMRNFLSEPTSDGQYRTVLKSTIEIHRAGSQSGLVTRQDFAPTEDLCRNRRHDYFHSYMINIPERVTVGPHVLKLIVEDQLNRKVASYSINFTVN